jgi:hypothetical protein
MAITGTLEDLPDLTEIADYDDLAHNLPWRGRPFGRGPWPEISDTPGGTGWTVHRHWPTVTGDDSIELKTDMPMKTTTAAYVQVIIDTTPPGPERGRLISLLARLNGAPADLLSMTPTKK